MVLDNVKMAGITHEFHFVLNAKLKSEIERIAEMLEMGFSQVVVFMIDTMVPVLDKKQYIDIEDNKQVEKVNWDVHAYVRLDRNLFRRIELYKAIMNVHSTAIVFRSIIRLFIKHYNKLGLCRLLLVVGRFARISFYRYMKSKKVDKRDIHKQLGYKYSLSEQFALIFNDHYQLLSIQILQ